MGMPSRVQPVCSILLTSVCYRFVVKSSAQRLLLVSQPTLDQSNASCILYSILLNTYPKMAPTELCLRVFSLGWLFDPLISGTSDTEQDL